MKYEEIVAGFQALQASAFDDFNVDARGLERRAESNQNGRFVVSAAALCLP